VVKVVKNSPPEGPKVALARGWRRRVTGFAAA
jgi:hypothetical protein